MSEVYMVQNENYSHVDSVWDELWKADLQLDTLNKDADCSGYVVVKVTLNKVIEDNE